MPLTLMTKQPSINKKKKLIHFRNKHLLYSITNKKTCDKLMHKNATLENTQRENNTHRQSYQYKNQI